jgi:tRNA(fMet)-specific endonuclease VapC
MALLLDTDHLSILHRRSQPECDRLVARLDQHPADDIATTIVSFHELVKGWLAYLNRARTSEQVVRAYSELESIWRSFCKMNVISFGLEAEQRFTELRKQGIRIGTMDLRIACVALETDSVVLTRNLVDFEKVPGLRVEDWTVESTTKSFLFTGRLSINRIPMGFGPVLS